MRCKICEKVISLRDNRRYGGLCKKHFEEALRATAKKLSEE